MDLLLDTHSLLWFIAGDDKLSKRAKHLIADLNNRTLVSAVSLWEITIKMGTGKLILSRPFDEFFPEQLAINKIEMLPIKLEHLAALAQLPLHHRDPFDRMIIAQAVAENLQIISKDSVFHKYPIQLIW